MRKFRTSTDQFSPAMASAYQRAVSIVLEGVSLNAFPYNPSQLKLFQNRIARLREEFDDSEDPDSVILHTGDTIRCLDEYGESAEHYLSSQTTQKNRTIDLLLDALLEISAAQSESLSGLRSLAARLKVASGFENTSEVNSKLEACLTSLRKDRSAETDLPAPDVDVATGLPSVQSAISAIREASRGGVGASILAFSVERMETINLRFGFAAGDGILLMFAQHIAQHMTAGDMLFRWRGPCFVVLAGRAQASALVAEASRITHARLEYTIVKGDREIVIAVAALSRILPIPPDGRIEETLQRLDEFSIRRAAGALEGAAMG